jgi:hypothetical protein
MHVTVDQARQHIALAQIDDRCAGKAVGGRETVTNRFDPAVTDDDGRSAARCLAWTIEQPAGVHEDDRIVGCLREGRADDESEQGEEVLHGPA